MARFEREPKEYVEKVVYLNRVSKTVKGGRVSKFSALVVVGDEKGKVGYGLGKAAEVAEAIRKGIEDAKKHMVTITLSDNTIPHEVMGEFGAGRVYMMPAPEGTGVLAAGVLSKCEYGFKVLGNGSLTKAVTVKASAFSESAKQKIEAAGGKAEVV